MPEPATTSDHSELLAEPLFVKHPYAQAGLLLIGQDGRNSAVLAVSGANLGLNLVNAHSVSTAFNISSVVYFSRLQKPFSELSDEGQAEEKWHCDRVRSEAKTVGLNLSDCVVVYDDDRQILSL